MFLNSIEFNSWLVTWLNQNFSIFCTHVLSWMEVSSSLNVKLTKFVLDPLIYIHIFGKFCVVIASICHCIYIIIGCLPKMEFGDAQVSWWEHAWISKLQLWLICQCRSKYQLFPGILNLPDYFIVKKGLFFYCKISIVKWYSKQLLWVYYTL